MKVGLFATIGTGRFKLRITWESTGGEACSVKFNDLTTEELCQLEACNPNDRDLLINEFVKNRFLNLKQHSLFKKTYQIQCYIEDNRPFVIFEKYNACSDVKWKLLTGALGIGKTAAGILISPMSLPLGAGLVASGIGDIGYTWQTPQEKASFKDYATQGTVGFVSGAAGGLLGGGLSAYSFFTATPIGTGLSGIAVATNSLLCGTMTEAAIKLDKEVLGKLTPQKFAACAVTGIVSSGISDLCNDAGNKLFFSVA